MKSSEMKRKIETDTDRGVGSCKKSKAVGRSDQKWSDVVSSGQEWSEMRILDFIFRQEYLAA